MESRTRLGEKRHAAAAKNRSGNPYLRFHLALAVVLLFLVGVSFTISKDTPSAYPAAGLAKYKTMQFEAQLGGVRRAAMVEQRVFSALIRSNNLSERRLELRTLCL